MPHKVEDTVIFPSKCPLKAQGPRSTDLKGIYMYISYQVYIYWHNKEYTSTRNI